MFVFGVVPDILRISSYSVQMRENVDQNSSKYRHFLRNVIQVYANNIGFTLKIRLCLCKIVISYLLFPFFILLFHLCFFCFLFFLFFCFPTDTNVYPKYLQSCEKDISQWNQSVLSLETIANELDFLRETIIIQWNVWKKYFVVASKQINRKKPNPCYSKEHYQSIIKKKNSKSVNQSEMIT